MHITFTKMPLELDGGRRVFRSVATLPLAGIWCHTAPKYKRTTVTLSFLGGGGGGSAPDHFDGRFAAYTGRLVHNHNDQLLADNGHLRLVHNDQLLADNGHLRMKSTTKLCPVDSESMGGLYTNGA